MRLVRQEAETLQLRALADAALAETLASLAYDKDFPGASPHAFAGGSIASAVTPVSPPSRYTVVVRAVRGRRARAVRADVARAPGRAWVVSWQPVVGGRASG